MTNCLYPPLLCLCAGPITAANFPQVDPNQVNGGDTKAQMARSDCENQLPHAYQTIKTVAQCIEQRSSKPQSP
jgi:hypothetical protein